MHKVSWPKVVGLSLVAAVIMVVLLATGFAQSLPSLVGGEAPTRNLEITQATAAQFTGPEVNNGFDVSFPQCDSPLPENEDGFAIVGITGGRPFKVQPCADEQLWWARNQSGFAVYMNTEYDGLADPELAGQAMADDAIERMQAAYLPAQTPVWLDVETENMWRGTQEQHRQLIEAIANRLTSQGYPVGIYSAPKLWREITGGVDPGVPIWLAIGKDDRASAERKCGRTGFGGRAPAMVQWVETGPHGEVIDHNLICEQTQTAGLLTTGGLK